MSAGRFVCQADPSHAGGVIVRVIEELDPDGIGVYVTNAGNPISWADGTIGLGAEIAAEAYAETEGLCECGAMARWDANAPDNCEAWEAENRRKLAG